MAVSTTNAFDGPYLANGVTVSFPFTFTALTGDDVAVEVDGMRVTGFSVALGTTGGGTVTFDTAPASGEIYVVLDPPMTQDTRYEDGSAWLAGPQNAALDRAALRDQALLREISRGVKAPIGDTLGVLPSVAERAGKIFAFDAGGRAYAASGSGEDGGVRVDLAEPGGAALVGFGGSTSYPDGSVGALLARRRTLREFGATGGGVISDTSALESAFLSGLTVDVPQGTYLLGTDAAASGALSWRNRGAFTGAGTIDSATDFPGFNYSADFRKVRIAEGRGSTASPVSDKDATALFSKHSNVSGAASQQNPTLASQHYKWNATALTVAQAAFVESIDKAGNASGRTDFVEGLRAHGIGMGAAAYGVVALGQVGDGVSTPTAKFAVAVEGETIRTAGTAAVDPLAWTSANNLDAAFLATVRYGVKPMAGFLINPYNSVATRCGFLVGNSFAAMGSTTPVVDFAAFATIENSVPYALYARGTNYAVISGPNNVPLLRALNAAGNAEHNLFAYNSDNTISIGTEATAIRLKKTAVLSLAASASPAANGEAVFQATSDTSFTIKYQGSDGVIRSGSVTLS